MAITSTLWHFPGCAPGSTYMMLITATDTPNAQVSFGYLIKHAGDGPEDPALNYQPETEGYFVTNEDGLGVAEMGVGIDDSGKDLSITFTLAGQEFTTTQPQG